MSISLYDHQIKAIDELKNGSILCADVGTGKSRTSLAYYYLKVCQGSLPINGKGHIEDMKTPRDLYIITTAKKRDSHEWEKEGWPFHMCLPNSPNPSDVKVTIDSWNNIAKYRKVIGAFFIFDEQRVVGSGAWVKAFLDISRKNKWILLSATPGDTWSDYIPVFVANGFYKNKTDFNRQHVIFNRFSKYPKIDRYVNTKKLEKQRDSILVHMYYRKKTVAHQLPILVMYDHYKYKRVQKDRWDVYDNQPIREAGKLCYLLRKVVNSDQTRLDAAEAIVKENDRVIIFYNYDYELDLLRSMCKINDILCAEWNGQKHEPVPDTDRWVYLVQYSAGAEGWNCVTTNVMVFYSQSYSYRMTIQAAGRIDRLNTKYEDLYYYYLKSRAPIDLAISRALSQKRNFNESSFIRKI